MAYSKTLTNEKNYSKMEVTKTDLESLSKEGTGTTKCSCEFVAVQPERDITVCNVVH